METEQKMTVSDAVVQTLKQLGAKRIFLIPGGANMHLNDAIDRANRFGIISTLCGDEIGAGFQAQVYGAASGTVGICEVTSGPGASKVLTALRNARDDSQALMVLSGNVATDAVSDAFQGLDVVPAALAGPFVKDAAYITDVSNVQETVLSLYRTAEQGRKGSVLIDFPRDIQRQQVKFRPLEELVSGTVPKSIHNLDRNVIREIAHGLRAADSPLLIIGQGARGASKEIADLVDQEQLYVVGSLFGLRPLPASHPYFLGMGGMNGESFANLAHTLSRFRIYAGSSIDDRLMLGAHDGNGFDGTTIVQVDIAPEQIGKILKPSHGIVADAKEFFKALLGELNGIKSRHNHAEWNNRIERWHQELTRNDYLDKKELLLEHVIDEVANVFGHDVYVITDVGGHQMEVAQKFKRVDYTSGRLGCMGFANAAAAGLVAAIHDYDLPMKNILNVVGDGSYIMSAHDRYDIARSVAEFGVENVPIKTIIAADGWLRIVRSWMGMLFEQRDATADLTFGGRISFNFPKFDEAFEVKLPDGSKYTMPSRIVSTREELPKAVREMYETPGPFTLQVNIAPKEVTPVIYPGGNTYTAVHQFDTSGNPVKLIDIINERGLL